MEEKLVVKNFGPIQEVDLDIKKILVFIGPQASGKSTIAKLLAIFRSIDTVVLDAGIEPLFQEYNISNYFKEETYLVYSSKDYKIIYSEKKWQIDITEEFKTKIKTEQDRVMKFFQNFVAERYKDENNEQKVSIIEQIYENNWRAFFLLLKRQVYIPAERILTSLISGSGFTFNETALPGCLTEFGRHFENSRLRIKELKIPALNITYKYDESNKKGARIYFDDTHSISLLESSSGIQAFVPIYLVMESFPKTENGYSYIVEEPELNLFPTAQKEILHFLITKCNHANDLIITTHSPYVLSVLNNLLFAYQVSNNNDEVTSKKVEEIFSKDIWVNPNEFNAYFLSNGVAKSIFNKSTNLIAENDLDSISQDIIGERDKLIELYKKRK